MGYDPSVAYIIDLERGEAYAYAPFFPNQRVDLEEETIIEAKRNMPAENAEAALRSLVREKYAAKYFQ